jgi:hypothetical protein
MTDLSKVLWVIQENRLGWAGSHDNHMLEAFLEAQGTPYREITVIPFDESPIQVDWEGPVIFYGSTKLVERVNHALVSDPLSTSGRKWTLGVWYSHERFSMQRTIGLYDELMLNGVDSHMHALEDLVSENRDPEEELFVRPVHDLKAFVGAVRKFKELSELLKQSNTSSATGKTEVLVSPPRNIHREWRCFMVDGRVVAHSEYKRDGELLKQDQMHYTPTDVTLLAERAAGIYSPAPVFVLDICELKNGELKIVETNCFNCAGVYRSSLRDIAREVTGYAARTRQMS